MNSDTLNLIVIQSKPTKLNAIKYEALVDLINDANSKKKFKTI